MPRADAGGLNRRTSAIQPGLLAAWLLHLVKAMNTRRLWQAGDEYWSLWMRGEDSRYFPMFEGRVTLVEGDVVRLSNGSWRYRDEGLAFTTLIEARAFVVTQPFASAAAPGFTPPAGG